MKSKKSLWSSIGLIAVEAITFIDLAIDLYTGEMTWIELCWILIFCVLLTILVFAFLRRRKRKKRQ